MKLHVQGVPFNINETIVGPVTRNVKNSDNTSIVILENQNLSEINFPSLCNLTTSKESLFTKSPFVSSVPDFSHLNDGDIVSVDGRGNINTLYRVNSNHNNLLVTEMCNSNCLMCSQPPKLKDDRNYLFNIHKKLIPLIPKYCLELGITGGEPTLLDSLFFELLQIIKNELPDTDLHVLTNGRKFAWNDFAKQLAELKYDRMMLGIPLYSDFPHSHDYIVQAKNAFNQTVIGLHNLAKYDIRIEIRIVLHKLTVKRLLNLSKFIYKNLPFVEHIAFMGLENTGYTPHNIEELWIDPFEYMDELNEAVKYLHDFGMTVSIYNLQLCILPEELWQFARRSISDWKNIYVDECSTCYLKEKCGGFFSSNRYIKSKYIHSLQSENDKSYS